MQQLTSTKFSKRPMRRHSLLEGLESRQLMSTYYVDAAFGSDAASGDAAAPLATLQQAANKVVAGDTVIVRPGSYSGFRLTRDGTASARITFSAERGATITSRNAVTADGVNLEGADYVTIQGFKVDNTGGTISRAGIRSVTNHGVIVRDNTVDLAGTWGVFTGFSEDVVIENNVTSRSQVEHGIYVSNSADRPVIRGNTIWGNRGNGIHMNGDASMGGDGVISGALVERNRIYENGTGGGSGINCDGVQYSRIQNNLLYNNYASGISLYRIDGGGGSIGNVIANNTVLMPSNGRWALNINSGSTKNVVFNNILLSKHSYRGSISISADSRSGFVSNYNIVSNRMSTDGGDTVVSLSSWRSATGQDKRSFVATEEQLFVSPTTGDYRLTSGSAAINKGASSLSRKPAPTTDLAGVTRPAGGAYDIGAYEFVA